MAGTVLAKKNTVVHVPLQMGFGFEVTDAQGNAPEFLGLRDEVFAAIDQIQQAQWASVDVETTGLTDASAPVSLAPVAIKQGASNVVRMRTIQVRVPTIKGRKGPRVNMAFDCDKMGPELTQEVARAILSRRMFIAHNAGFDLYWLRRAEGRTTMPAMVVDSMLMTRLLCPKLVLKRAVMVEHIKDAYSVEHEDQQTRDAWKSLISGASGGSLADVVLAMFNVSVDKTYQKPTNWTGLLGFEHHTYAIDDVVWADRILCKLFEVDDEGDLLQAYLGLRARRFTVRLLEPQVPELVEMREHGMPINSDVGFRYAARKRLELAKKVDELINLEPSLEKHRYELADPDAGIGADLKVTLADAFQERGVNLRRTSATNTAQIGEKDLRACRAAQMEESRPLFNAWVAVCRSKKTSAMALEVVGFAQRSGDGYLRALLSHGPVTGRLSASEANVQQFPRDQLFRAMCVSPTKPGCEFMKVLVTELNQKFVSEVAGVPCEVGTIAEVHSAWMAAMFWSDKDVANWPDTERAALDAHINSHFLYTICSSDFGALDVRVGAALCIRSQREMLVVAKGGVVPGDVQPPAEVVAVIKRVAKCLDMEDAQGHLDHLEADFKRQVLFIEKKMAELKEELDAGTLERKQYYKKRGEHKSKLLCIKMGYRFAQCLAHGQRRGEREYSALRDAFVAGIDIHTFTGMKLIGRDPMKEFAGLVGADRSALEKKLKKELGPRRQQGKIANLSLLYGMADAGFQEAAARGYDEHWTLEESHDIRALWMDAYPEVELWHLWTECLECGVVYVPEVGKDKPQRKSWYIARTLAGREIVAFGLNAALSYQDQSSGADILGLIIHRFKVDYPPIFDSTINQVHDEQVFMYLSEYHEEYLPIIETVMVAEADSLTMPYGVPCAVSPACGPIWVKD